MIHETWQPQGINFTLTPGTKPGPSAAYSVSAAKSADGKTVVVRYTNGHKLPQKVWSTHTLSHAHTLARSHSRIAAALEYSCHISTRLLASAHAPLTQVTIHMAGITTALTIPAVTQISDANLNNANSPGEPMRVSPKKLQKAKYEIGESGDQVFTVPGQSFTTMVYSM
jgi:hypothetical protein